jgi:hypothetical protein
MAANHGTEDGIYPLTIIEIAKAKKNENIKSGLAFSTY